MRAWLTTLLVAAAMTLAPASLPGQDAGGDGQPGTWYRGRFIGFVPAHQRPTAATSSSPAWQQGRPPRRPQPAVEAVGRPARQVDYHEPAEVEWAAPAAIDLADRPCDMDQSCCELDCGSSCGVTCWWGRANYLLWWTRGMNVPPLATTGSVADPLPAALGQPDTRVLFGDGGLNDDARSGGRFTIGKWICPQPCAGGVEVSYLFLGEEDTRFSGSGDDFTVLGRPFFNTTTAAQDARLIVEPGAVTGTLDITATTKFQSLEVLYRKTCCQACCASVDFVVGYRFAELEDHLRIDTMTRSLAGAAAGTEIDLFDQFDTRSTFHGAELGVILFRRTSLCWSWEAVAKVALGESEHRAAVAGQTTTRDNLGNVAMSSSGLLALDTNSGSFGWDDFATLSEFGVSVRRDMHCGLTASFGYSILYWSDAARAGDQIDTTINPTQIPPGVLVGQARPAFPSRTTDFWAQGLRFGLEYNF